MFGLKKEKDLRFKVVLQEGQTGVAVLVDKQTGVNYLSFTNPNTGQGGVTVLVDSNGKPLITEIIE